MANTHAPVVVAQEIGHLARNFLREVGSVFWFIAHTLEETLERIQRGRVPFRAASFFRHTARAGVDSVPLVWLVAFFLGLTMALLTGYQLQRFGTERLIPGLVAISFHAGAWSVDYRHHAGGTDRCGVYGGIGHHAGLRRSRSDRGDGNRAVAFPGRAANARPFFSDAVPVHGVEHRGHFREQS